jgi:hypothetical protein
MGERPSYLGVGLRLGGGDFPGAVFTTLPLEAGLLTVALGLPFNSSFCRIAALRPGLSPRLESLGSGWSRSGWSRSGWSRLVPRVAAPSRPGFARIAQFDRILRFHKRRHSYLIDHFERFIHAGLEAVALRLRSEGPPEDFNHFGLKDDAATSTVEIVGGALEYVHVPADLVQ